MIRCIYSPFTDIYFHLAAEEYLLKQGNEDIFHALAGHSFCGNRKASAVTVGSRSGMGGTGAGTYCPSFFPVGEQCTMIWAMSI